MISVNSTLVTTQGGSTSLDLGSGPGRIVLAFFHAGTPSTGFTLTAPKVAGVDMTAIGSEISGFGSGGMSQTKAQLYIYLSGGSYTPPTGSQTLIGGDASYGPLKACGTVFAVLSFAPTFAAPYRAVATAVSAVSDPNPSISASDAAIGDWVVGSVFWLNNGGGDPGLTARNGISILGGGTYFGRMDVQMKRATGPTEALNWTFSGYGNQYFGMILVPIRQLIAQNIVII